MPGGEIRFAVGAPNAPQSTIWRVWATRNTCDVYLGPRPALKQMKTSLHESGDYRQATPDRRLVQQWKPAQPLFGTVEHLYCVLVFPDAIAPSTHPLPKDNVFWARAPSETEAVRFDLCRLRKLDSRILFNQMFSPVRRFDLVDGGEVALVVTHVPTNEDDRARYAELRREMEPGSRNKRDPDRRGVGYFEVAAGEARVATDFYWPPEPDPADVAAS
jgi:hypothetical protein